MASGKDIAYSIKGELAVQMLLQNQPHSFLEVILAHILTNIFHKTPPHGSQEKLISLEEAFGTVVVLQSTQSKKYG